MTGPSAIDQKGSPSPRAQSKASGCGRAEVCLTLHTCLHCDVTFEQAWAMASTIPAALIGLQPPENVTVSVTDKGFTRQPDA